MKLREKLKTTVSINTEGEAGRFANQCEQIADDYAIEFAEWLMDGHVSKLTLKEFKKEKGL